jgi:hypothetical protein
VAEDAGISGDQAKRLGKRGPVGSTQEEQWYLVWDIVFPSVVQPSSPYLDADLSEEVCEFREFFSRHGSDIVVQHMRNSAHWTDLDEQRFTQGQWSHVLSAGLDDIYNRWLGQRARAQSGPSRRPGAQLDRGDLDNIVLETSGSDSAGHYDDADTGPAQLGSHPGVVDNEEQFGQLDLSLLIEDGGSGQRSALVPGEFSQWYEDHGIKTDDDGSFNAQGDAAGIFDMF